MVGLRESCVFMKGSAYLSYVLKRTRHNDTVTAARRVQRDANVGMHRLPVPDSTKG